MKISLAPMVLLAILTMNVALADEPAGGRAPGTYRASTMTEDPSSAPAASGAYDHTHALGALGMGGVAATNNVQGSSAGVAAQIRFRANGREANTLYDTRMNLTYNVISEGQSGASTTITLRGESMVGWSAQNIRNRCSFYGGMSGYVRGSLASANNGAANSFRTIVGPETGLACDVAGMILMLSPSVGIGGSTNASNSLSNGPMSGGTAVMGGGVARLSVNDRLHLSARAATTIPQAALSGGATANMTMVGADVDLRVSDSWSLGVDVDGIKYAHDCTPASQGGSITRVEGQATGVVTAVF